jgi:hypothetical protein
VFILGAGVSASYGIPVAKDILRMAMMRLNEVDHAKADEIHRLLEYFYPHFSVTDRNYPNIEEFLNLLEMAKVFNKDPFVGSSWWTEPKLKNVEQIVLRAIANYVFECQNKNRRNPDQSYSEELKNFLRKCVTNKGVVITFNWDTTVEAALLEIWPDMKPHNFYDPKSPSDFTTLLKPHGSINWFTKNDLKQLRHSGARKLHEDVFVLDNINFLLAQDLITDTPLIVPPISNKNLSSHAALERTWISTYWALRNASEVTILGYSLPKEDQFARVVIRRALRNRIEDIRKGEGETLKVIVVNPDETTEETFARVVGRDQVDFKFHGAYFRDYVKGLVDSN